MTWVASAVAAAGSLYKIGSSINQKQKAKKLKESTYVPSELFANRDLALQQAYGRRAPGAAQAESQARRIQANQIGAAQRSFGGDTNKMAAVTSAATAQANDVGARIAAQGQQFSENAFGRVAGANNAIAGQKLSNRNQYLQAKNALNQSAAQNMYSGIDDLATVGVTAIGAMQDGNSYSTQSMGSKSGNPFGEFNPDMGTYYNNPASQAAQNAAYRRLKRGLK